MNFDVINFTSLAGNPLRSIDSEAFRDAKIKVRQSLKSLSQDKKIHFAK